MRFQDYRLACFTYRAFGLNILSEIEFRGFRPSVGPPDVFVRLGVVPIHLDGASPLRGILYEASSRRFLFSVERVARYLASDGNQIDIEPAPGADLESVLVFLHTCVFGALLYQRGVLPLHASAVIGARGAVVIAGRSGYGKSTLAGALHRLGFPVIADEICAVETGPTPAVLPSNPCILLWPDAIERLGVEISSLRRQRPSVEKFVYPVDNECEDRAVPIQAIYFLEVVESSGVSLTPVTGIDTIRFLAPNAYRNRFVESMNLSARLFLQLQKIAGAVPMAKITRPASGFLLDELTALLTDHLAA